MILAGFPFAHEINFSTGLPTGAIVYSLLGNDGLPLSGYDAVSVTPAVGALSHTIIIPGTANTVSTPLFEVRTLVWSYTTTSGAVNGREQYRVERSIGFPVSPQGVRNKLGLEIHDLADNRIDLLRAYSDLAAFYEDDAFLPYEDSGDRNTLIIADAIEAMAAIAAIPTLQLLVAQSQSSGTNKYARFTDIDWAMLRASLTSYISPVNDIIDPLVDIELNLPVVFVAVERTDPITGE